MYYHGILYIYYIAIKMLTNNMSNLRQAFAGIDHNSLVYLILFTCIIHEDLH